MIEFYAIMKALGADPLEVAQVTVGLPDRIEI